MGWWKTSKILIFHIDIRREYVLFIFSLMIMINGNKFLFSFFFGKIFHLISLFSFKSILNGTEKMIRLMRYIFVWNSISFLMSTTFQTVYCYEWMWHITTVNRIMRWPTVYTIFVFGFFSSHCCGLINRSAFIRLPN